MREGIKKIYQVMLAERELEHAEEQCVLAGKRLQRARMKMAQAMLGVAGRYGAKALHWLTPEDEEKSRFERYYGIDLKDMPPASTEDGRQ
jgi:hypothetical protein